jgi:hypothetical protein
LPVNDLPTTQDFTITIDEDSLLDFSFADFLASIEDIEDTDNQLDIFIENNVSQ